MVSLHQREGTGSRHFCRGVTRLLPCHTRNCKLSSSSLSMAAVDILYIDITRRWNSVTVDQRDTGTGRLPCLPDVGRGLCVFCPSIFHSFTLWRGAGRGMVWNENPEASSATKAGRPLPKFHPTPRLPFPCVITTGSRPLFVCSRPTCVCRARGSQASGELESSALPGRALWS